MGRNIFRRTSASFVVGLLVPFHPRRGGLGRRSTGLPESGAAICGALNLREIFATSARGEIAPSPFRISPTDSGLRRLEKELCTDIIIARLLGQSSAVL